MKRSHMTGLVKALAALVLGGACAACAGVHSQPSPGGDSASLGNHMSGRNPSDISADAFEQRNRDIVKSVTGRAM